MRSHSRAASCMWWVTSTRVGGRLAPELLEVVEKLPRGSRCRATRTARPGAAAAGPARGHGRCSSAAPRRSRAGWPGGLAGGRSRGGPASGPPARGSRRRPRPGSAGPPPRSRTPRWTGAAAPAGRGRSAAAMPGSWPGTERDPVDDDRASRPGAAGRPARGAACSCRRHWDRRSRASRLPGSSAPRSRGSSGWPAPRRGRGPRSAGSPTRSGAMERALAIGVTISAADRAAAPTSGRR